MPGPLKVFLIEDDPDDRELLELALQDNEVVYRLDSVNRGDLVVPWMESCQNLPDIIIMDLNLPKLHGREVICKVKENPKFKKIPFLVLTTSSSEADRLYCLEKGADQFMSKPSDHEGFKILAETILKMGSRVTSSH
jgi:DNA-binding response OmpR family regulator